MGFLASIAAVIMGWIPEGTFDIYHALLISASAVLTASFASFVLGTSILRCFLSCFCFFKLWYPKFPFYFLGIIMVVVIIISHRYKINPDSKKLPISLFFF